MHAIPPVVSGRKVDPTGKYKCPLCKVQSAGDDADTGWVACPMVKNHMICLGSCIDYQKVARSSEFAEHPEHDLFEELSKVAGSSVDALRGTCLRHQIQIIDGQLEAGSEDAEDLRELRELVLRAMT